MSSFSNVLTSIIEYFNKLSSANMNEEKHTFCSAELSTIEEEDSSDLTSQYTEAQYCLKSAPVGEMLDCMAGYKRALIMRKKISFHDFAVDDIVRASGVSYINTKKIEELEGMIKG